MIIEKFFTTKYDEHKIFVNSEMSFGEFKKYVFAQKSEFEKKKEESVVLFCDDYFEYAVNFFASIFAHKNIYLLADKTRLEMLDFEYFLPERADKCHSEHIEILRFSHSRKTDTLTLESSARAAQDDMGEESLNPDDIRINLFTSGSTGVPKNIVKTLKNLEIEAQETIDDFDLPKNGIISSTTSSAHSYGLAFNFILAFYGNFSINRERIEFPEQFKPCDILISTPSFMEKLCKYDFVFETPPKKIFLAGAKLKNEVYEYFARYSDVIDIYGSTETGNIAYKRGGNVFTLISGVDIESGENNQIVVKTPFCPFEKMPLSDIVEKVSDYKFILKKRTDRIVKIQEKRISLDELETNMKKHHAVEDCCCFMYDEKLCCAVVCRDPKVNDFKKHLSKFSEIVPKKWRILDEIPKTQNGKIDSAKLRKIFGMKLSLPFVLSRNKNGETFEINMVFKENSNFFEGHFDGFPIVPGVVQLYYAKFFAEDVFNINISAEGGKRERAVRKILRSAQNDEKSEVTDQSLESPTNVGAEGKKIKFSNVMKPETIVTLKLTRKGNNLEFVYMNEEKTFSSGIFSIESQN